MSLCRWSSDNFRSDLYCYESSAGGFLTHVASSRIVGDLPMDLLQAILRKKELGLTDEQITQIGRDHHKALEDAPRLPIGLPHDGQSFVDGSLEDWKTRIVGLIALGYCVPDGVVQEIDEMISAERLQNDTPAINDIIRTAQQIGIPDEDAG